MSDRFKFKYLGNKTQVEPLPLEAPIIDPDVFLTLSMEETITINAIIADPKSFKTTVQINGKDVIVYATPGCSITVPGKNTPIELRPLDNNPIQNTGKIFNENHPVIYMAHSDVTVEDVTKRNIFGWVKLDVVSTRDSSVINTPVSLGPETFGTSPLYSCKVEVLNEAEIIDTEFTKVNHILGASIHRSVIKAEGNIVNAIIDDLNLHAKNIHFDDVFISSCAFTVKKLSIVKHSKFSRLVISDHNFFGKNATLVLTTPLDIFKVELGLFSVVFATSDKSDTDEPEFFAFSGHYGDDEKLSVVNAKTLPQYLDQLKAEILTQNDILQPNATVDNDALESVLTMVLNTLTSRVNLYKMLGA